MNTTKVVRGVTYSIAFVLVVGLVAAFAATTVSAQQVYVTPTCSIFSTASSGSGQPVTLSWNSSNATTAILSPGGGVAVRGMHAVGWMMQFIAYVFVFLYVLAMKGRSALSWRRT